MKKYDPDHTEFLDKLRSLREKLSQITDEDPLNIDVIGSEIKYRTIFDNSAVGITVVDKEERIREWNGFTEKMTGYGPDDLEGREVKTLYPEEEWKRMRAENIRQKGMQHHFETRLKKKDGSVIDIDISVSVLRDEDNKITGAIGVMRDITKRKKLENAVLRAKVSAEQANRLKGEFLYELSQKVVSPMKIIKTELYELAGTDLDPRQRRKIEKIRSNAAVLKEMLDDINDTFQELKEEKFLKIEE